MSASRHVRQSLAQRIRQYQPRQAPRLAPLVEGRLTRVVGLTLEAVGCNVVLGGRCCVTDGSGREIETEVVGFDGARIYLMPLCSIDGLQPGAKVIPIQGGQELTVGTELLGRVLNGLGQPLDGRGPVPMHTVAEGTSTAAPTINPLQRQPIRKPLDVGIAAINALLTVGRGQRLVRQPGHGLRVQSLGRAVAGFIHSTIVAQALRKSRVYGNSGLA